MSKINLAVKKILNKENKVKKFKVGGIVAGGVGHDDYNEIGDRGIPVVSVKSFMKQGGKYDRKHKRAEVESEEIVFNRETAVKIDKLVDEYNSCKCKNKLISLGNLIIEALKNTTDETCRTGCKFEPKLKNIK